jgi:hypothetical protein
MLWFPKSITRSLCFMVWIYGWATVGCGSLEIIAAKHDNASMHRNNNPKIRVIPFALSIYDTLNDNQLVYFSFSSTALLKQIN